VQGGVKVVALYRRVGRPHPACGVAGRPRRLKIRQYSLSTLSLERS